MAPVFILRAPRQMVVRGRRIVSRGKRCDWALQLVELDNGIGWVTRQDTGSPGSGGA